MTSSAACRARHMPDRFWISVFEDCDNFVANDTKEHDRIFSSKLNSYAAVSTGTDGDESTSLKAQIRARRDQIKNKMGDIEAFVISAAKINLYDDKEVALSNLMKAQRLYARMTSIASARKNDCAIFSSNEGDIPYEVNVVDTPACSVRWCRGRKARTWAICSFLPSSW
ncbi:hypothetical protein Pcinc_028516 [Petrolisthes cinctipes]|uniref:Uncharacterized protein n=1 Tax=Petrolisthes cinctipes TaxID=88211 RepID=A0AAE1K770_PETCI|nr:hypothetical protein Pcinc_028516 [Petrolisthes cinctipes]